MVGHDSEAVAIELPTLQHPNEQEGGLPSRIALAHARGAATLARNGWLGRGRRLDSEVALLECIARRTSHFLTVLYNPKRQRGTDEAGCHR
jgi:hypothetical protein